MKKICSVLLLLTIVVSSLLLSGCGAKSSLTSDQQNMLLYGGILGSRNGDSFDALDGGYNGIESVLEDYWGITDADSAIETLDWLVEEGHRANVDEFFVALQNGEEDQYKDIDDTKALYEACNKMLLELGLPEETLKNITTVGAWDYDRIVNVARWSFVAGYITNEQAWEYLQKAREMAQTEFSSWNEYFASNVYGRSIAYDGDPEELRKSGDFLLNNSKSIWNGVNFK